jgi:8-oxo-dGTP pyrophosphatase MutT (NUDIX family)
MPRNILSILDELRAISIEGLTYAKDKYDIDRYNKLMKIITGEYSEILDLSEEKIISELRKEVGCITPKLGTDVAITNIDKKLLVLKRTDDDSWSLPCGWVDVGEKPFDTAVRESKEEAGIDIEPLGYIAITEKGPHIYPKLTYQVNVLVAAKPLEKEISISLSHEHSEYKWIDDKEAKTINWHQGHERLVRPIFNFIRDGKYIPHFE